MTQETIDRIRKFSEEIDWDQFHGPANLAKSIVIEAAELFKLPSQLIHLPGEYLPPALPAWKPDYHNLYQYDEYSQSESRPQPPVLPKP